MSGILLLKRPLLAYSDGKPGFDPSHPAAGDGGTRYSIISGPGVASRNLLNPSNKPTNSTAPTSAIDGVMGPILISATSDIRYSAAAITDSTITVMAIASVTTISAIGGFIGGRQGGASLAYSATGQLTFATTGNNTATATNIVLTAGVPYFLAASSNLSVTNFVAVNLLNGQTLTQTVTSTLAIAVQGTLFQYASGSASGVAPLVGKIACGAYTNAFLTLPKLQQVATEPWSFWYPRTLDLSMMLSPAQGLTLSPQQVFLM